MADREMKLDAGERVKSKKMSIEAEVAILQLEGMRETGHRFMRPDSINQHKTYWR